MESRQELKETPRRNAKCCILVCFPWPVQIDFFYNPGLVANEALPTVARTLPHQPLIKKCPTHMLTSQCDGGRSSVEGPLFPGESRLCQVG